MASEPVPTPPSEGGFAIARGIHGENLLAIARAEEVCRAAPAACEALSTQGVAGMSTAEAFLRAQGSALSVYQTWSNLNGVLAERRTITERFLYANHAEWDKAGGKFELIITRLGEDIDGLVPHLVRCANARRLVRPTEDPSFAEHVKDRAEEIAPALGVAGVGVGVLILVLVLLYLWVILPKGR